MWGETTAIIERYLMTDIEPEWKLPKMYEGNPNDLLVMGGGRGGGSGSESQVTISCDQIRLPVPGLG